MSKSQWDNHAGFIYDRGNIEQILIICSNTGGIIASRPDSEKNKFGLKEYHAQVFQEDGTEKEELINEAQNILKFMKGETVSQGLRCFTFLPSHPLLDNNVLYIIIILKHL